MNQSSSLAAAANARLFALTTMNIIGWTVGPKCLITHNGGRSVERSLECCAGISDVFEVLATQRNKARHLLSEC